MSIRHVTASYVHLLCIGCPRVLRSDLGTENCGIAKIHIAFRMNHTDSLSGDKSFIYGPSTANTVSISLNIQPGVGLSQKKCFFFM